MKLLCISNGHGEDVIACRILTAFRQNPLDIHLSALPITGSGSRYQATQIPIIGPTQVLPSGGFLNRDPKQLARDLQKGLVALTWLQLAAIRDWASVSSRDSDAILAVGDIVPQIFAHLSGLPYAFIGTAKSEYWLRDAQGNLLSKQNPSAKFWDHFEGWSGSVYLPWERWLMARPNCRTVFVRDTITAQQLQHLGIRAHYAGNPMMDGLSPEGKLAGLLAHISDDPLIIAILPGSRPPEAYENWARILAALPSLSAAFPHRALVLLGAIAPSLSLKKLQADLSDWTSTAAAYPTFTTQNMTLHLITDAYNDCLHAADIAIATAGTATEQFVGLGKPAITLPGKGPQFTQAFATVQAKMLGLSVQMVSHPDDVGQAIAQIINSPDRRQQIYDNGKQRMGEPGASSAIAQKLIHLLTA